MKSFKKTSFVLLIPLFSLLLLFFDNGNNVSANTSQTNTNWTNTKYVTKNAKWADTFKRQGYSYSLLYGEHDYILTNLSQNQYDKIVKDKVRFQVRHISTYKNGISANLVSKDNKYNIWAVYPTDFYYTNSRSKELKPIVKLERNILLKDVNFNHGTSNQFKKLNNMVNRTKFKNKQDESVARTSVYQLKRSLSNHNTAQDTSYLLLGNLQ